MTGLLTFLGNNPKAGLFGTAGSFSTGAVAGVADQAILMHGILEYLQAGAFIATIVVALVTVYAQHLKIQITKSENKKK